MFRESFFNANIRSARWNLHRIGVYGLNPANLHYYAKAVAFQFLLPFAEKPTYQTQNDLKIEHSLGSIWFGR